MHLSIINAQRTIKRSSLLVAILNKFVHLVFYSSLPYVLKLSLLLLIVVHKLTNQPEAMCSPLSCCRITTCVAVVCYCSLGCGVKVRKMDMDVHQVGALDKILFLCILRPFSIHSSLRYRAQCFAANSRGIAQEHFQ